MFLPARDKLLLSIKYKMVKASKCVCIQRRKTNTLMYKGFLPRNINTDSFVHNIERIGINI